MYCTICNKNVIECTCKDIEERLKKLEEFPIVSLAAKSNLTERKMRKLSRK